MNNDEIIEQLENIRQLLTQKKALSFALRKGNELKLIDTIEKIKADLATPKKPSVYENFPEPPRLVDECSLAERGLKNNIKAFVIALLSTIVVAFLYNHLPWSFLSTLKTIGILTTIITAVLSIKGISAYKNQKARYENLMKNYHHTYASFMEAMKSYDQEKDDCIAFSKEYVQKYTQANNEITQAFFEKTTKDAADQQELARIEQQLDDIDFISPIYYDLIDKIIYLLVTEQADSYTEALRLAIKEENEAAEQARQLAEEARQAQLLRQQQQQQAEEERRMQIRQQMEARDQQRRDAAEARYQRQQADLAAHRAKLAGLSKCHACANESRCPSNVKNNGGGLNCGGFRPR